MPSEVNPGIDRFVYAQPESTIMDLLRSSGKLTVEEILARAPHLSWSQVFLAIDVLSRKGDITLHREGFAYTVETARHLSVAGGSNGKTAPDH